MVHNADCDGPNPWGRKGDEAHQAKIQEIKEDIIARKLTPDFETCIILEEPGVQGHLERAADITAWDGDKLVEVHQVGKALKDGLPVARERHAMTDINTIIAPLKVIFHDKNN